MNPPETSSAAARLCAACGLCCNGVMFHHVRMQPGDAPRELAALGLKLKRKKGENYLLQPCPQYQCSQCAIYAVRPVRCRLFECRQLKRVAAGEIPEAFALAQIHEAKQRVAEVENLLHRSGRTDPRRPLSKRCEKIMAEPVDPSADSEAIGLRHELTHAMQELETVLNEEFRLPRIPPAASSLPE